MPPPPSNSLPVRLSFYVGAIAVVAVPVLGLALAGIALDPPSGGTAAAVGLFFALSLVADLRPVPMDEDGKSEVSVANIFIVTVAILFGWHYAVPLAAASVGLTFVVTRRPWQRTLFNASMYGLSAWAAAAPVIVLGKLGGSHAGKLTGYVLAGSALHLLVNVTLVAGAISIAQEIPYRSVAVPGLRSGGAAWAIMALLSALAANLWAMNPWLLVLLAGPLFTLTLYQRSALRSRIATRDALTDNLTRLGNHRAYQAALRAQMEQSDTDGSPFSLCLVDVDNFKQVNDCYGHPAGDEVLLTIASLLADIEGARAFRFGGDEFAVIVTLDEMATYREIERVQRDLAVSESAAGEITISIGISSYPAHADSAEQLQRTADGALYWSKHHGKNRTCLYSPSEVRIYSPEDLERQTERNARLRAARNLVRFVDARDSSTANHSQLVSELAEAIGLQLGLDDEAVGNLRLAGLLHDIGKIGLPDAILRAPRPLTPLEFESAKLHPEFGYSLLQDLGVEPVDDWVLHHHEHWDGSGYPQGLRGEQIPLGARIILVADAFEAITSNRPYRPAQGREAALRELHARAGSQFDPTVVAALERHVRAALRQPARALG